MPLWFLRFYPVLILLAVVGIIFYFLPTVDVGHDKKYLRRRITNWLPLGLTYAFLYMGRYNLKVSKFAFEEMQGADGTPLMGNADFGHRTHYVRSKDAIQKLVVNHWILWLTGE